MSPYQVLWCIIDTMSRKKIFKYQEKALNKLGFSVIPKTSCSEIVKHYRDKDAVIADRGNIRKAYEIVKAKRADAIGSIMTDKQFGSTLSGESTIVKTTTNQREFFRALVGERNHPYSNYQPEMFDNN